VPHQNRNKVEIMVKSLFSAALLTGAATMLLVPAEAEVYLHETFSEFPGEWVESEFKDKSEMGSWKHTAGEYFADSERDKGIKTGEDARFYGLSRRLSKPFDNKDKDLILQMSVKHEQGLDCGGGYIKLLPGQADQKNFGGDTPYSVMFGPDICGSGTQKTHVIFGYDKTHTSDGERENLLISDNIRAVKDKLTHVYTLVLHPNNSYKVLIDSKLKREGELAEDFPFFPPKEIDDPDQSKPDDWVDTPQIPDPEDKKPDGWDDIPANIPDPEAKKPDDWDEADDGEWEAPTIPNPEYKGTWKPKVIDNPEYKGEWEHPQIANPDFFEDENIYHVCNPCDTVGFELWQVTAGTIFDNILVTDDRALAEKEAETILKMMEVEKEKYDADEKERKEKAEAEAKEAARKQEALDAISTPPSDNDEL